ncbi:acetyl-CoA carboxylase biotin carboxylase subunit [Chlamydiota bacterium]
MFDKILIANRGEIALRIIRACKELGIKTVAIFSEADATSSHVRFADEAICIGPPASTSSYLNIPAIISAAEISDVEAIHPGYGFLAENTHFAEICENCKITFIGPSIENIQLMGNKAAARETMIKANVPVIPGSEGTVETVDNALEIAEGIGYPVIIKASGGGGGKGMRIAKNEADLASSFMTARTEAQSAFDNKDVYIEKYIEEPRHIEFQILADNYGNTVHLGERDCTIQRRHQKLIEESPSIALDETLRSCMGKVAVKAAKTVGYSNAGTIEFLLDKNKDFYFMEMNTRIQVEHPVTEMVTGIDIIKEQLKIAAGEKLSFTQNEVHLQGAAMECRINAEDPAKNFLPSPGKIDGLFIPGGLGVRVDTHVYQGYSIPPYYDSMIGKLIVHGKDREHVLQKILCALDEFVVTGIATTIDFYKEIITHPAFIKGEYSTHFIDEQMQSVKEKELQAK